MIGACEEGIECGMAAKRGLMWGGNQMLDEWFQGEFVFGRSGVRVSGGSEIWDSSGVHEGVGGYTVESGSVVCCECWRAAWGCILGVRIVVLGLWGVFGKGEVITLGVGGDLVRAVSDV